MAEATQFRESIKSWSIFTTWGHSFLNTSISYINFVVKLFLSSFQLQHLNLFYKIDLRKKLRKMFYVLSINPSPRRLHVTECPLLQSSYKISPPFIFWPEKFAFAPGLRFTKNGRLNLDKKDGLSFSFHFPTSSLWFTLHSNCK
jgi:hypothetical protein